MKFFNLDEKELPDVWIVQQIIAAQIASNISADTAFALQFNYSQVYLPDAPVLELLALIHVNIESDAPIIHLAVCPFIKELAVEIQRLPTDLATIRQFAKQHGFPVLNVSSPWVLEPVYVPKPWGQEIWFTGIEVRGQSAVKAEGGSILLPWVLALFPQGKQQLILLKVLDPLPDEVYGDLYFELHEEKQEVYVVTAIDQCVWPECIGSIQLGFASDKRREYANDNEFKSAYLKVVQSYEHVRRLLDIKLDAWRQSQGIKLDASLDVNQLKDSIRNLSQSIENKELINAEKTLRQHMSCFVNHLPLRVGDALAIPQRVPHALQHGIRVVEFQTPVYERKILSFAQKVLTQNHWDTEHALAIANMDYALDPHPNVVVDCQQVRVEQIVSFDDFLVQRVSINNGAYEAKVSGYSLVMPISGELNLICGDHSQAVSVGGALLVPGVFVGHCRFSSDSTCLFLHAWPRLLDKS